MYAERRIMNDKPKFYEPEVLHHLQELEMGILRDLAAICEEHHLTWFGFCGTGIGAVRHKGFIPWDDDIDISMPRRDHDELIRIIQETMSDKYHILNADTDPNYPLANTRICLNGTTFREYAMRDVDCDWGIFLDVYPLENAADNDLAYYYQMWSAWFWGKLMILRSVEQPYLYFHGLPAQIMSLILKGGHHTMKALGISKEWLHKMRERHNRRYDGVETKRIAYFCDPLPYTNTFTNKDIYPLQMLDFEDIQMPFPANLDELLTKMFGDYMTPPPVDKRKTHYPYELDFGPYGDPRDRMKKRKVRGPLVSICIPAYNSERFIERTIRAALDQTYTNIEVVVVDDGSKDRTVEIVQSISDPRLRLIVNEENLGMTGNWNKCVRSCQGDYVKLIPADDILYPESIEKSVRYLRKYEDVKLVITGIDLINNEDEKVGSYASWGFAGAFPGKRIAKCSVMLNNFFGNPVGAMFRRADFEAVGGFDPKIPIILDFDLWLGLAAMGDVAVIPEKLGAFRVRTDSNTGVMVGAKGRDYTAEHARLLDKHIAKGSFRMNRAERGLSIAWRAARNYLIAIYIRLKAR